MSKIIESVRGDLAALQEAGAITKVTMREFDSLCPPPYGPLAQPTSAGCVKP